MKWQAASQTDEDLIAARDFIAADNESAARDFLDAAFETFDRLAQFPKIGQRAHFKHRALRLIFTHRFIAGRRVQVVSQIVHDYLRTRSQRPEH